MKLRYQVLIYVLILAIAASLAVMPSICCAAEGGYIKFLLKGEGSQGITIDYNTQTPEGSDYSLDVRSVDSHTKLTEANFKVNQEGKIACYVDYETAGWWNDFEEKVSSTVERDEYLRSVASGVTASGKSINLQGSAVTLESGIYVSQFKEGGVTNGTMSAGMAFFQVEFDEESGEPQFTTVRNTATFKGDAYMRYSFADPLEEGEDDLWFEGFNRICEGVGWTMK